MFNNNTKTCETCLKGLTKIKITLNECTKITTICAAH